MDLWNKNYRTIWKRWAEVDLLGKGILEGVIVVLVPTVAQKTPGYLPDLVETFVAG